MSTNTAYRVRLISIKDASIRAGLGRTRLSTLLNQRDIASVKLLDRHLVVADSLEHFIARQRERGTSDKRVRVTPA
jgi:hypothetical protein